MELFINVFFACFGYKANRNLCFRVSFERDRKKYNYCRHTVIRFPTLHWRLSSFVSAMSKERLGANAINISGLLNPTKLGNFKN